MPLSKSQLKVITILKGGGHIWVAAKEPYLYDARVDGPKSTKLNRATFAALLKAKLIKEVRGNWVAA